MIKERKLLLRRRCCGQLFSAMNCAVAGHDIPVTPAPAPNTQNTSSFFGFVFKI